MKPLESHVAPAERSAFGVTRGQHATCSPLITALFASLMAAAGMSCQPEASLEVRPAPEASNLDASTVAPPALIPARKSPTSEQALPVSRNSTHVMPSDTPGGGFGSSLGMSQDEVLIGSGGAAYLFQRIARTWTQQSKLIANDPELNDRFGSHVALHGNLALISAARRDAQGADSGAVYAFSRNAQWAQEAMLFPSNGAAGDHFGSALSLNDNQALIGAPGRDAVYSSSGAAYVFERSAGAWLQTAELLSDDAALYDNFGESVAIEGNIAAVGGGEAAYLFERNAGNWAQVAKLVPDYSNNPAGGFNDHCGWSISLSEATVLMGCPWEEGSGRWAGAAYLFSRSANVWSEQARFTAPGAPAEDRFGISVSIHGDKAVVGGVYNDDLDVNAGAAYVFLRSADSWSEGAQLLAHDGAAGDSFGQSVGISTEAVLVSARRRRNDGAVYTFGLRDNAASCADGKACLSGQCVQGLCCDSPCPGPCERCNLAATAGECTLLSLTNDALSCAPYRCDGRNATCPASCTGDGGCTSGYRCRDGACVQQEPLGDGCWADSQCLSGHCVAGICCDSPCDGDCQRCDQRQTRGTCTLVAQDSPGNSPCDAYRCDGAQPICPESCTSHEDCAQQHHCENQHCVADLPLGEACQEGRGCQSTYCTDGLCCVASDCGAYRCSPAGACELSCSSSGQCAAGYHCSSRGQCAPAGQSEDAGHQSGSCSLASYPAPEKRHTSLILAGLGLALARRTRRRVSPRPPCKR